MQSRKPFRSSVRRAFPLPAAAFLLLAVTCSEDRLPLSSKTHPKEWSDPLSSDFHGAKVVQVGYASCTTCHGKAFDGGSSGVSCAGCHEDYPHAENWTVKASETFHGNSIRRRQWSSAECRACHGQDYDGGRSGSSCRSCHSDEKGPEACNVCHGNAEHIYPPEDLNHNTSTKALGVGAHEKHMKRFRCSTCHQVPESFDAPSHIDPPPAEVEPLWKWDRETGTCAGSCHGSRLVWNDFE